MNWEAVGAIAELFGALGVIASLVFLTLQIRMNTKALRGTASFEAEKCMAQGNRDLVHDREVTAVLIKAYDPSASLADFSDDPIEFSLHFMLGRAFNVSQVNTGCIRTVFWTTACGSPVPVGRVAG